MNSPTKVVDVYPIMIKVRVNMISDVFLGRNTLISSVVAHSSHSQSSHHTAVCTSHVPLMWMTASDCGDAHTCEGAGDTGLSLRLKPTHTSCGACVCNLTLIKHMWHMYSTTACVTWQSGTIQIWHCSVKSSDGSVLIPPDRNHTCRTSPFPFSPTLSPLCMRRLCEWRCISSGRASICLAGNSFLFLLSSFSHISRGQAAPHSACQQ